MYKLSSNGTVVQRTNENGIQTSFLLDVYSDESSKYKAWLAEGNTPDPEFSLDEIKGRRVREIKQAGFARVHTQFPPHRQRRLAFKPNADGQRTACRDMIEAVRTAVDAAEAVILDADTSDETAVNAARDAVLAEIAAA